MLAFDFDGTIAPIVANPKRAFTLAKLRPVLRALEKRAHLAVITGRAIKDVKPRLMFEPEYVVGNHGIEGLPEFKAKAVKSKSICRKWMAQLKRDIKELPAGHGIYLEYKITPSRYISAEPPTGPGHSSGCNMRSTICGHSRG
ncbi:MAG: hypothetical protein HC883_05855 [Bdellovibrionaceae bacterium]|nr:hypothetical protein [Pseudobdellovibrionaceae bacterium]